MVLDGPGGAVLIDCAGSPIGRLEQAGVPFTALNDVVITHIHPDHAYGFPLLLMGLWLLGRKTPLRVHALGSVLTRLQAVMEAYDWNDWPRFYPVLFEAVEEEIGAPVLETADFRITAARNQHMTPTIGLRIEQRTNGRVAAYSSDTSPCDEIVELARGADLLFHEASGGTPGHSSAAMAGETARKAGVKKLVLVHYQVGADPGALAEEAEVAFGGPVEVAQDLAEYALYRL